MSTSYYAPREGIRHITLDPGGEGATIEADGGPVRIVGPAEVVRMIVAYGCFERGYDGRVAGGPCGRALTGLGARLADDAPVVSEYGDLVTMGYLRRRERG